MAFIAFVASLKLKNKVSLVPAQQEEYLNNNGMLNLNYLMDSLHSTTTTSKLNAILNNSIGRVSFVIDPIKNEVTEELFKEHYEFGTYRNIRGWIGYFDRAFGLLLTREKLYEFVVKS